MKLSVRSGRRRFALVLPVRFLLRLCIRVLKTRAPDLAAFLYAERRRLCRMLKEARRTHGSIELVRIESRAGERITISI